MAQSPDLSPPPRDKGKGRAVDFNTQNVFDLETQVPDLDVAAPSSQHLPTSASLDSQAMTGSQLQAFVEYHSSQGVPGDKVLHALFRTSFRPELAEIVLEATRKGEEIPEHIPGVWTDQDDKVIDGTNAVKIRAVEMKHGRAEMDARIAFLEDYRNETDDDE